MSNTIPEVEDSTVGAPRWVSFLLAVAVGVVVASVYYAQPLVGLIASELDISTATAALIVTVTQLGYVGGLVLIVPLGDLVENRRLALAAMSVCVVGLAGSAVVTDIAWLLIAVCLIGIGSVAVQIFVPFAARLATDATRGRSIGTVTSGLMLGIMLARPISSLLAEIGSWHTIFAVATIAMLVLIAILWRVLPTPIPSGNVSYTGLLASMPRLVRTTPLLRRRIIYQTALFGSFSLFWKVTTALYLSQQSFPALRGSVRAESLHSRLSVLPGRSPHRSPAGSLIVDRHDPQQKSVLPWPQWLSFFHSCRRPNPRLP